MTPGQFSVYTSFVRFVHYRFQTAVCSGTSAQTEWNALIHYHFIYEYDLMIKWRMRAKFNGKSTTNKP